MSRFQFSIPEYILIASGSLVLVFIGAMASVAEVSLRPVIAAIGGVFVLFTVAVFLLLRLYLIQQSKTQQILSDLSALDSRVIALRTKADTDFAMLENRLGTLATSLTEALGEIQRRIHATELTRERGEFERIQRLRPVMYARLESRNYFLFWTHLWLVTRNSGGDAIDLRLHIRFDPQQQGTSFGPIDLPGNKSHAWDVGDVSRARSGSVLLALALRDVDRRQLGGSGALPVRQSTWVEIPLAPLPD